ncbi:MAG: ParB N-terminal domain-containing protein [Candidatus Omnitrophica bacterium]|nr:ParB N-terminal domain-containing protein [Candidatus Omnitrophota bacterium]
MDIDKKEKWPIEKLKNWENNPRTITKKDFNRLKNQIKELGEYKPLIITKDGTVIGGNMRLKAYQELGFKEVWVSVVDAETEEEKIKYALSDNDQVGKTEKDQLAELLSQYPDISLENYSVHFKEPEPIKLFLDQFKEVEEDEVPEVDKSNVKSKRGEVYQLGRHRLMCGDSTKKEDVERLMDGKRANVLITDPPYGVDYSEKNTYLNAIARGNRIQDPIKNDNIEDYKKFFTDFLMNLKGLFDNSFYIFINGKEICNLIEAIKNCGYHYAQDIVWVKNNHVLGRMDYAPKHESIVYGWQDTHKFFGGFQTSVIEFNKPTINDLHPTMKPVGLLSKLIKDSTLENNIVLDIFGGSGSTLIACEQTNRICYMMEIDPYYCDVIRKRYAKFIGKEEIWEKITPRL